MAMEDEQAKIAEVIIDLLHEYDTVVLPGFGAFVSKPTGSSIDHVQGVLHPPSKSLKFNPRMMVDDGLVYERLQEKMPGKSLEEVKEKVTEYVSGIREKLDNQDIVAIPEVGRLYKDFEQKIQFLQDDNNFNKEAYGLPDLKFYPILRQKTDWQHQSQVAATRPPTRRKRSLASWLVTILPFVFGTAVLGIAIWYFVTYQQPAKPTISEAPKINLNKKPTKPKTASREKRETPSGAETTADSQEIGEINTLGPVETEAVSKGEETDQERGKDLSTRENSLSGKTSQKAESPEEPVELDSGDEPDSKLREPKRSGIRIVAGHLSRSEGVTSMVRKIESLGYKAYTRPARDGLTQVGAFLENADPMEVQEALTRIQQNIDPGAFVKKN